MGRAYLIFIMVAGMFGCMLSQGPSRMASSSDDFRAAAERSGAFPQSEPSTSSTSTSQEGTVELTRSYDGHFYADVQINGAPVRMMIDTGASGMALSREDARSAGIATSIGMNDVVGRGADGFVKGEFVTLERVTLGHKSAERLEAVVLNSGEQSLLGQSFLSQFSSVEIQGDRMLLR